MSRQTELRALRYGRSADAPISYHHRSGDEEGSGGSMLDYYAQAESVEDTIFGEADELAKQLFITGIKGYMRKVFPKSERAFLSRLMSGRETPQEVGRALGVDWWKHLHAIQKRAYKNLTPLLKLSERTGWSGGEAFTEQLLKRLRLLETGGELPAYTGASKERAKARAALKAAQAANLAEYKREEANRFKEYYEAHREEVRAKIAAYRAAHPEKVQEMYAKNAAYRAAHREELREKKKAYNKEYYAARREEIKAYQKEYKKTNEAYAEKRREGNRKWKEAHREEIKAYNAAYREKTKAAMKAWQEEHREELRAYQKAYREAHREELRAYREAHREEAKAYAEAHREEINAKKRASRGAKAAQKAASLSPMGATSAI